MKTIQGYVGLAKRLQCRRLPITSWNTYSENYQIWNIYKRRIVLFQRMWYA